MPGFSKPLSPRGEIKRCRNSQPLPDLFQPRFSPAPCPPSTRGSCLGNYLGLPSAELISPVEGQGWGNIGAGWCRQRGLVLSFAREGEEQLFGYL